MCLAAVLALGGAACGGESASQRLSLGEDRREQLENAEITFADEDHASVPPLTPDEEGPIELVREDDEWRIVVEDDER